MPGPALVGCGLARQQAARGARHRLSAGGRGEDCRISKAYAHRCPPPQCAEGVEANDSVPEQRGLDVCLPGAAWAASLVLRSDMACVPESCEGWRNQRTGNAQSSPLVSFLAGFGRHAGGRTTKAHAARRYPSDHERVRRCSHGRDDGSAQQSSRSPTPQTWHKSQIPCLETRLQGACSRSVSVGFIQPACVLLSIYKSNREPPFTTNTPCSRSNTAATCCSTLVGRWMRSSTC